MYRQFYFSPMATEVNKLISILINKFNLIASLNKKTHNNSIVWRIRISGKPASGENISKLRE